MTLYTQYYSEFKDKYTMYIPLTIILQSCLGGIAAMYILMNGLDNMSGLIQLFFCVILTSFYNAAILAQLREKWVFNMLIISLLFSMFAIIFNAL
ncbi:hypothetical protein U8527_15395 [Kordia algicida OT-1]|uniref:Uncharacterized protein n=1 Tax=Kordia algicida OT-1 TaxID=391587 RepID=A9E7W7_9FLAO|nr:hypothetical protein [Kordia algicida]EDP94940.1 hypothetical protein KAOT1_09004 [Kordia algicida OT-1]